MIHSTTAFDLDAYVGRSRALDLSAFDWADVANHPLPPVADHPVLTELLEQIVLDESRHFFYYYRQAELRLQRPVVARVARQLVDRFWAPVGNGVQPRPELQFMARYRFAGDEGRAAARKVDDTIRKLPGSGTVQLLETWMDRFARPTQGEP